MDLSACFRIFSEPAVVKKNPHVPEISSIFGCGPAWDRRRPAGIAAEGGGRDGHSL